MFAITPRLLLRPSWPEDAATLHSAIADKGIVRNLASAPWPYTMDDAANFARLQSSEHFPSTLLWLRTGGAPQLVGGCGLGERNGAAELGYWIARPFWGQGLATEAARAVVSAARTLGHRRIVAGHFVDNPASGRVLCKLGFRATGKVEQRQSRGRDAAAPSLLFERDLAADEAGDRGMARFPQPRKVRTETLFTRYAA
jgi:RimJ/RimL family protein N-acetyltransferase